MDEANAAAKAAAATEFAIGESPGKPESRFCNSWLEAAAAPLVVEAFAEALETQYS